MRKTHNKELAFIIDDWNGNPIDQSNSYINLDGPSEKGFLDLMKWQLGSNPYAKLKKNQETNVQVLKQTALPQAKNDFLVWLGHATFLFQLNGKRILTDPVLFDIWPLRRYTEVPFNIEELVNIDLILLSHNHRDHADKKSMVALTAQNPKAIIYTGLGIGDMLKGWGISNVIIEAGWYQEYPALGSEITVQYLPAKHWSRRYLHDLNRMLWGSFMIHFGDTTLYFGGDSGKGRHFTEIGRLFDIDIAFLGIGAYEPIWFMHPSHTSPKDALEVKDQLGARYMVPMHYGTFDLSDEPIFNPKNKLKKIADDREDVKIVDIGDTFELNTIR